ncbi:phage antirepressor N-terminal domain-containing protein [Sphingomonas koreensis]|uniref:phage antirepressor N-terminal domain-containing protein n=1 Tax=Sphingomonas koreensis TaxID=93064 RepID=UPI000F7E7C7F|nr:phage antirepressor N-terminal domain-containing protein [Sphingomonas koreensis]MDC7808803.1 phage antirepressor N-terminal domain-containing protein [Sphingomonas koreensis]RSU98942.1 hypothetical protein CA256_03160 [Sphingomonas koreensis]
MASHPTAVVPFHGSHIPTVRVDGDVYVVLKAVADAIGLRWSAVHERVSNHQVLKACIRKFRMQVPGQSQSREHVVLPIKYLNGWLFQVNPDKARPEVRESLLAYQLECFAVLDAYWRHGFAANPRLRTIPDAEQVGDGILKSPHKRFVEERLKFDARSEIPFERAIERLDVLSKHRWQAIERGQAKIHDKLLPYLSSLGFDIEYILRGERVLTEAERAVRDVMRNASAVDRGALLAHAASIPVEVVEHRDAYGEIAFLTNGQGDIVDHHTAALLN